VEAERALAELRLDAASAEVEDATPASVSVDAEPPPPAPAADPRLWLRRAEAPVPNKKFNQSYLSLFHKLLSKSH